jgi:hypothetical protein
LYIYKQNIPCEREHTNTIEQCYAVAYEGLNKFYWMLFNLHVTNATTHSNI